MEFKEVWSTLSAIDVNNHVDQKGKFSYLSWTWGWATLMDNYPESNYTFREPVFFSDGSCEVWCDVTIEGHTRSMWLPVMDYKNKSMINPSSRDISDTRMRCLIKTLAMFGLGHYIYAGESVPENAPIKPTDEETATFKMYFENEDDLRFFLFARFIGDDKYTSLYNSAPKDKMKFKAACDELEKNGLVSAQEIVSEVETMIEANDPAWSEALSGLEKGEKSVLWNMFKKETQDKMLKLKEDK